MKIFGLIGKSLSHSFSKTYFARKFEEENIKDCAYRNFEISSIEDFQSLIETETSIRGLNVTIPYKEVIIPHLDGLSPAAEDINAVNTIEFKAGALIGHNTDYEGFIRSLQFQELPQRALVLGSGGSSKAVQYALRIMGIPFKVVSRSVEKGDLCYSDIDQKVIRQFEFIINCTPLGMHPNTTSFPDLPYSLLNENHFLYDLIYNPVKTLFLERGIKQNARVVNGYEMLKFQAEAAWNIWNSSNIVESK